MPVLRAFAGQRSRPTHGSVAAIAFGVLLLSVTVALEPAAPTRAPSGPGPAAATWASDACPAARCGPSVSPTTNLAGDTWVRLKHVNSTLPPPREGAALASDPAAGGVLLFGGCGLSECALADTWWYEAGVWANLTGNLSVAPPARWGAVLAFDPSSDGILLFGGCTSDGPLADSWLFVNGSWSELGTEGSSPGALCNASGASDPAADGVAVYGGTNTTGATLGDLWIFSNGSWSAQPAPGSSPGPRASAGMAFDAALGGLVLFGGLSPAAGVLGDLWLFRGGSWTPLATSPQDPVGAPAAREAAAFAYDPSLGGELLFGGSSPAGIDGDTWLFANESWTNVSALVARPPAPHADAAATFDASDGYFLMEGGFTPGPGIRNDTWAFVRSLTAAIGEPYAVVPPFDAVRFQAEVNGGVGPYRFNWTFGDGTPVAHSEAPLHSFATPGDDTVGLEVLDLRGLTAWSNLTLTIGTQPLTLTLSIAPAEVTPGATVAFSAAAAGGVPPYRLNWTGLPDGCLPDGAPAFSCVHVTAGVYPVSVTVTDASGATAAAGRSLEVTSSPAPLLLASPSNALAEFERLGWILVPPLAGAVVLAAYASVLAYREGRRPPPPPKALPPRPDCYVTPEWSETPTGADPSSGALLPGARR